MNYNQTWSIIALCYNEEESIAIFIEKLDKVLKIISSERSEIIIVNDGSTDNSTSIVNELEKQYPNVRAIHHPQNMGIGAALRSGYFSAQYENVCAVSSDGQFDTEELIPYGSFPADSFLTYYRKENTTYSLLRNGLSLFNKKLNEYFLGIKLKDVNWTKAYKLAIIRKLDLQLESSLVESEICCKLLLLKYKPVEIQSKYLPRIGGESKGASLKIVLQAIKDTIRLVGVVNKFKKNKNKNREKDIKVG